MEITLFLSGKVTSQSEYKNNTKGSVILTLGKLLTLYRVLGVISTTATLTIYCLPFSPLGASAAIFSVFHLAELFELMLNTASYHGDDLHN
ncbi:hypothetical protein J4727_11290 [Providencia rettgeri]|uniref:Uncharacterized protein n=1 Tax=Providencia rettgeri TaxID=587 RepID=A0A939SP89_PRORE|nr:hypothetical protein [Providencia rettgeri]